jgi:hypothetical protein
MMGDDMVGRRSGYRARPRPATPARCDVMPRHRLEPTLLRFFTLLGEQRAAARAT